MQDRKPRNCDERCFRSICGATSTPKSQQVNRVLVAAPAETAISSTSPAKGGRTSRYAAEIPCKFMSGSVPIDFAEMDRRLQAHGTVRHNDFILKFWHEPYEMTLFPDGRAIIKGTTDTAVARSLYARFVGS